MKVEFVFILSLRCLSRLHFLVCRYAFDIASSGDCAPAAKVAHRSARANMWKLRGKNIFKGPPKAWGAFLKPQV